MTNENDKQTSEKILKHIIASGYRFFVAHQRTSPSGMSRWYKVYAPAEHVSLCEDNEKSYAIHDVTWYVAKVIGEKLSKEGSIAVKGQGFNAYDHLMKGLAVDLGMDTPIKFDKG